MSFSYSVTCHGFSSIGCLRHAQFYSVSKCSRSVSTCCRGAGESRNTVCKFTHVCMYVVHMYNQYKKSRYPQPIYIGFCINCFGQISVTIERFLPKLAPLDAEKILHKTLYIEKSTSAGPYMVYFTAESCKSLRREWARSLGCTADSSVRESALLSR